MTDVSRTDAITKRAWTLPEAIFSNRVLHYTSDEMVWDCNERRFCECGRTTIEVYETISFRIMRLPPENLKDKGFKDADLYRDWDDIVQLYSERTVGRPNDKLLALSKLAEKFNEILESYNISDTYLAGMWKKNLAKSLLWHVEDDDYRRNRDAGVVWSPLPSVDKRNNPTNMPPSWSWASMNAPVLMRPLLGFETAPDFEIIEATTKNVGSAKFGMVSSGQLRVKGRVIEGLRDRSALALFMRDDSRFSDSDYFGLFIGSVRWKQFDSNNYFGILLLQKVEGAYKRVGVSSRKIWANDGYHQKSFSKLLNNARVQVITII